MAVLPTPGSPMRIGLFLVRRRQHLHGAPDLVIPPDDRVQPVVASQSRQIPPEDLQRTRRRLPGPGSRPPRRARLSRLPRLPTTGLSRMATTGMAGIPTTTGMARPAGPTRPRASRRARRGNTVHRSLLAVVSRSLTTTATPRSNRLFRPAIVTNRCEQVPVLLPAAACRGPLRRIGPAQIAMPLVARMSQGLGSFGLARADGHD